LTYLGYPASTGARCFDFRLTDAVIDPAGAECVNSEALLRLPQTMFCYRRDEAPDVSDLPALTRAEITFCSFNNLAKVGPRTLGLWVAALQAVPNSRLFLKAAALAQHGNREFIRRHFASFGIDPDRITLQPFSRSVQEHLSLYREVDIGLDSFPFNGATTTCEALLMGVPVITLAGLTQPSRMGASILRAVGLSQFVAKHEAHYAALASSLAADLPRLAELRGTMRDRLLSSRLWNRSGFTIDFEALLEAALTDVLSRDRVLRPQSF
jgi:predicted O-linked N-acetylglucosamine transferase (SPINDLY family)